MFCYEAIRLDVTAADVGFALRGRDPKTQQNKFITRTMSVKNTAHSGTTPTHHTGS